jgi:hypothetical protein
MSFLLEQFGVFGTSTDSHRAMLFKVHSTYNYGPVDGKLDHQVYFQ